MNLTNFLSVQFSRRALALEVVHLFQAYTGELTQTRKSRKNFFGNLNSEFAVFWNLDSSSQFFNRVNSEFAVFRKLTIILGRGGTQSSRFFGS